MRRENVSSVPALQRLLTFKRCRPDWPFRDLTGSRSNFVTPSCPRLLPNRSGRRPGWKAP